MADKKSKALMKSKKYMTLLMMLMFMGSTILPSYADTTYKKVYSASAHHYVYVPVKDNHPIKARIRSVFHNPVVQKAGIGTAAGVGVAAIADHSLLKGGLAGAAAGTGVALLDKNQTLAHEPLARRSLKGGVIGLGVGVAAGTALLPATAIGVGVGAGVHYVKKFMNNGDDR